MQEEGRPDALLHRDNSRFKFLHDNGRPTLPSDLRGVLSLTTSYEMVHKQDTLSA